VSWRQPRAFTLRLHASAAPPRVGLTQALGATQNFSEAEVKRLAAALLTALLSNEALAEVPPGKDNYLLVVPVQSIILFMPAPNQGDLYGICVDKKTRKIVDRASTNSCPTTAKPEDLLTGAKAIRQNAVAVTQVLPYFNSTSDILPAKLLLVVRLSRF
jgi:hypothetical protein